MSDAALVGVCANCVALGVVRGGYVAEGAVVASYVSENAAYRGDI